MQHGKWHFKPEDGGHVALQMLQLQPVDPIAYRMSDVWGYDEDELPIEPFDIEIRVTAPTVLDGLKIFADAVQTYMLENFGGYAREQFLERLDWTDEYAEVECARSRWRGSVSARPHKRSHPNRFRTTLAKKAQRQLASGF